MKYPITILLDQDNEPDRIKHFEKLAVQFKDRGGKTGALRYLIDQDIKRKGEK